MIGLLFLCSVYFLPEYLLKIFNISLPPALFGIAVLFISLLVCKRVPQMIEQSARPLLTHMSLFFIPAIVAVVNFSELIFNHYFALVLSILICTMICLALTALLAAYLMPTQILKANSSQTNTLKRQPLPQQEPNE